MCPDPVEGSRGISCREEGNGWPARRGAPGAEDMGWSRGSGAARQQAPDLGGSAPEREGPWAGRDGGGQAREPVQAPASRNGLPRLPLDEAFPGLGVGGQVCSLLRVWTPLASLAFLDTGLMCMRHMAADQPHLVCSLLWFALPGGCGSCCVVVTDVVMLKCSSFCLHDDVCHKLTCRGRQKRRTSLPWATV